MPKYAQIDLSTGVCIGISYLSEEVDAEHLIPLGDEQRVNLRDVYNNGVWTAYVPPTPDPKEAKIAELDSACNAEILAGFTSSALGAANTYDFDYEAQTNLGGMLNAITAGIITTEPISWKASGVPTNHTFAQFKKLFADGLVHKNSKIQKYWALKAQVNAATTPEEVSAITW